MERAKKMVLMPQETVDRLCERKTGDLGDTRVTDPASRLDVEMRDILHQPGKTDREKWKLYRQVLHRYLFFAGEKRKPLELIARASGKSGKDRIRAVGDEKADGEHPNPAVGIADANPAVRDIVQTVPQKYQRKAELLLGHLTGNGAGIVSWDRHGEISIAGAPIPGTNIVDLINDVVRERKNIQAAGRTRFATILHQLNTPKEYIGNPFFWKGKHDTVMPAAVVRSPQYNAGGLGLLKEEEEEEDEEEEEEGDEIGSNSLVTITSTDDEEQEEGEVVQPSKKKTRTGQTGAGHWWWTLKLR